MLVASSVVASTAALTYTLAQIKQKKSDSSPSVEVYKYELTNSFTDAVIPCKERLAADYEGKITSLRVDTRSSFYHHELRIYKIFIYSDIESPALFGGKANYEIQAVCHVRDRDLSLAEFRSYRRVGGQWPSDQ